MTDQINRADAIRQIKEEIKDFEANYMHGEEDDENYGHNIGFVAGLHRAKALIKELPSADAVTQSEQYKKGFEDAKRAFELEFAREAESIRKRNTRLEVMLNVQKAISAEAGWIPCSERLPEKDDLVLVTVWNDVTIAWRNIYGGWESAEDMYEKGDVIAWMPLPKPYRKDGE